MEQRSWRDFFMQIVLICSNLAMLKIWYDLDYPSGLGRRGAPDFGMKLTHLGSPCAPDEFFTLKNATGVFTLQWSCIIDIMVKVWRKSISTFFATHFWQFSPREMAEIAYLTNHCVFSLHFFCNDVFLLHEHQIIKHHSIWCSGWFGVKACMQKVEFTPRPFRHVAPCWQLSSSPVLGSHISVLSLKVAS